MSGITPGALPWTCEVGDDGVLIGFGETLEEVWAVERLQIRQLGDEVDRLHALITKIEAAVLSLEDQRAD